MSNVMKGMLLILLIIYIASPVDLCPGPVDDIILLICAACGTAINGTNND